MLFFYLSALDTQEERTKFEEIYKKYGKLMKYVAYNILRDDSLAEDAVHNAFLKLIKYIDRINDVDCHKTKSFVVIVTESVSKDMYAKRKREATVNIEDNEQEIVIDPPDFDSIDTQVIADAIGKLPEIYRDALILKYVHQYKDAEIGELLGISPTAVRKRLQRAKEKLVLILGEEGDFNVL